MTHVPRTAVRPVIIFFLGCFAMLPMAQQSMAQATQSGDTGPSLTETVAWIEAEGPGIMQGGTKQIKRGDTIMMIFNMNWRASEVSVKNCTLSWVTVLEIEGGLLTKPDPKVTTVTKTSVPLKVILNTRAAIGPTITDEQEGKPRTKRARVGITVTDTVGGERLAKAFRRAAVLCGASLSPF
jgi:hypothetical protein